MKLGIMRCYNLACDQNSKDSLFVFKQDGLWQDGSVLCKNCYDVWMELHPDCGAEIGKYIKARSIEDYINLSNMYFSFYFDIWLETE